MNVGAFNIVPEVSEVVLISFNLFFFFPLCFIHVSAILSSMSLILSSTSVILLLVPSRVFLISFIEHSKITADSDCSHEIKRLLLLGRKVMTNLLLSLFSRVRLYATPETAAHQAPPSLGFSRQEHWSGLPFPSPMHESEK